MKKIKVYISSAMRGHDLLNFPAFFAMAEKLRDAGLDVINPAEDVLFELFNGQNFFEFDIKRCLIKDMRLISGCDAVIVFGDYSESKGAKAEAAYAEAVGIPVLCHETILKDIEPRMSEFPFNSAMDFYADYVKGGLV